MAAQNGAGASGLLIGGGIVTGIAAVAAVIWALQPDPEAAQRFSRQVMAYARHAH